MCICDDMEAWERANRLWNKGFDNLELSTALRWRMGLLFKTPHCTHLFLLFLFYTFLAWGQDWHHASLATHRRHEHSFIPFVTEKRKKIRRVMMTKGRENDTKANEGYKGKLDMELAYTKL